MTARQPRYSKEEFAHRGQALYEKCVRPQVERGNSGRIVAIDIETDEFEVGDDAVTASGRLLARCPDAQPWCVRIGHRAIHRFGQLHGCGAQADAQEIVDNATQIPRNQLGLIDLVEVP